MHRIDICASRHVQDLVPPSTARVIRRAVRYTLYAEGVLDAGFIKCLERIQAIQHAYNFYVDCEVSVLLTDGPGIREINREKRQTDAVTDVLSFPCSLQKPGYFFPQYRDRNPDTGCIMLGDIALCLDRCALQGEVYGTGFLHEISYLTVHSVLHLLGYDHVDEAADKRRMREREKRIMAALNI